MNYIKHVFVYGIELYSKIFFEIFLKAAHYTLQWSWSHSRSSTVPKKQTLNLNWPDILFKNWSEGLRAKNFKETIILDLVAQLFTQVIKIVTQVAKKRYSKSSVNLAAMVDSPSSLEKIKKFILYTLHNAWIMTKCYVCEQLLQIFVSRLITRFSVLGENKRLALLVTKITEALALVTLLEICKELEERIIENKLKSSVVNNKPKASSWSVKMLLQAAKTASRHLTVFFLGHEQYNEIFLDKKIVVVANVVLIGQFIEVIHELAGFSAAEPKSQTSLNPLYVTTETELPEALDQDQELNATLFQKLLSPKAV